jgi:methionyl-tRNA synthetase
MDYKYFDGMIKSSEYKEDIDNDLINNVESLYSKVENKMNELRVGEALDEIFNVLSRCNKYIDETTPWILAKDESKYNRLGTVLYNLLESIRVCAVILQAFLPDTSKKILEQLNVNDNSLDSIKKFGYLKSDVKLNEPVHLFDRIDVK